MRSRTARGPGGASGGEHLGLPFRPAEREQQQGAMLGGIAGRGPCRARGGQSGERIALAGAEGQPGAQHRHGEGQALVALDGVDLGARGAPVMRAEGLGDEEEAGVGEQGILPLQRAGAVQRQPPIARAHAMAHRLAGDRQIIGRRRERGAHSGRQPGRWRLPRRPCAPRHKWRAARPARRGPQRAWRRAVRCRQRLRRRASLHVGIIRPSSALGHDPVDVLGRVLDVARLAVDAILRVDLKPREPRLLDELVDPRRAISLLRPRIVGEVDVDRDRPRPSASDGSAGLPRDWCWRGTPRTAGRS